MTTEIRWPPDCTDALQLLCGDRAVFLRDHWEHRPHLHRSPELGALLTLDEVDSLLCTSVLPAPHHVRIANVDGAHHDWVRWLTPLSADVGPVAVADTTSLLAAFASGDTVVLRDLRRLSAGVDEFAHALELVVSHPVTAAAYLTPPGHQGFRPHFDTEHVFMVQTHGSKEWAVWPRLVEAPVPGYAPDRFMFEGDPWRVRLEPGDVLYIPRGHPHAGAATAGTSLHVTISVRQRTYLDAVNALLARLIEIPRFRRSLPMGFDGRPDELRTALRLAIGDLATMLDESAIDLACDLAASSPHVPRTARGALHRLVDELGRPAGEHPPSDPPNEPTRRPASADRRPQETTMSDEESTVERLRSKLDSLELADDERALLYQAFTAADTAMSADEVLGFGETKTLRFAPLLRPRPATTEPECNSRTRSFTLSLEAEAGDE